MLRFFRARLWADCGLSSIGYPFAITLQHKLTMNFFLKFGRTYQKCTEHDEQVVSVCYDARCTGHRFICRNERCGLKHSSHRIKNYQDYKQCQTNIQKHVKLRESIEKSLDRYKDSIVGYLSKIFQQLRIDLFSNINNKYCEKRFLEIEKLYKKQADYVPLTYDYKQCIPQKIYVQIESTLLAKQKHINKVINKQEVLIDFNSILKQKIQEFNTNRKEDQIRAILPFKDCELKLKFTASKNNFLSKRMYDLNIRGPIVLYVQSYKNRRFGGYSSIMFPKYEDDYSIQHRNVHSFLFSLDYGQILPIKDEFKKFAIKGGINFGFGQGDLLISDECNKGNISWAEIGRTYKEPHNCKGPTNEWLAGSSYFRIVQYQIYEVQVKREK